jgi:ribosomal protein L11 methyltransferase
MIIAIMKNGYVEVKLLNSPNAAELLGMLPNGQSLGSWESDDALYLYWPEACWNAEVLRELKRTLANLGMDASVLSIRSLPDHDWNAQWVESIQPIRIGKRVRIRQSWNSADPTFSGIELVIDPKRAFGSGYHVTTQLLIEMLEERVLSSQRMLDIGTGSGVLAMVALRLGAAAAVGIDIDPIAIDCARENAVLNGFGNELQLLTGALDELGPECFELIVANLDRNTFLKIGRLLGRHMKAGGIALLSGLQPEDLQDVALVLAESGGNVRKRNKRDEWIAVEVAY